MILMLNKTIMLNDSFITINDDEELFDDEELINDFEGSINTPIYNVETRENDYATLRCCVWKCCFACFMLSLIFGIIGWQIYLNIDT